MILNLVVGVALMMLCLVVQMLLLLSATHYYGNHLGWLNGTALRRFAVVAIVMLLLLLGNLLQGAIWAGLFLLLKEFDAFSDALYHSLVNFSTLGYGDIVMSERWRLLGPLQAVNGVLMIGISTASIGTVVTHALSHTLKSNADRAQD